jgi:flagellar assembly protein FliH
LSSLLKFNDVNIESNQFVYTNFFVELDSNESESKTDIKPVAITEPAVKADPKSLMEADKKAEEILETDKREKAAAAESARRIRIAEETKLAEADKQAQEIINSAKIYASKIRSFARKKAEIEYEEAKTAGFKEGYEAGKEIAVRENNNNVEELKQLIKKLDNTKITYIEDTKQELLNLTFKIAEKILGEKLDKNEGSFISVFKNAVKDLTAQKWVKLSVSEFDYKFSTANADLLKNLISGAESIDIEVVEKAPKGTCIIETSEKILDASVNTQLESLYNAVVNS